MSFFGIPQFRKEIHFIWLVEFEGDEKCRIICLDFKKEDIIRKNVSLMQCKLSFYYLGIIAEKRMNS